jgi:phosphoribosylanthranilate isomerase
VSTETVAPFAPAWAWLFDAAHPTLYGGSGRSWDFSALPLAAWQAQGRRVFLAGGIGPDNVAAVLAGSRPQAIDVCSRVESSPGIKDAALLRRLFEEMKDVQATALP